MLSDEGFHPANLKSKLASNSAKPASQTFVCAQKCPGENSLEMQQQICPLVGVSNLDRHQELCSYIG